MLSSFVDVEQTDDVGVLNELEDDDLTVRRLGILPSLSNVHVGQGCSETKLTLWSAGGFTIFLIAANWPVTVDRAILTRPATVSTLEAALAKDEPLIPDPIACPTLQLPTIFSSVLPSRVPISNEALTPVLATFSS